MTQFLDGPAAGVSLMLARAPLLLRVVHDEPAGAWDALDQLADEPKPEETIFVYRRASDVTTVHVDYTDGGRRRGAWYVSADYRVLQEQPAEEIMRSTEAWRAWRDGSGREVLRRAKPALPLGKPADSMGA